MNKLNFQSNPYLKHLVFALIGSAIGLWALFVTLFVVYEPDRQFINTTFMKADLKFKMDARDQFMRIAFESIQCKENGQHWPCKDNFAEASEITADDKQVYRLFMNNDFGIFPMLNSFVDVAELDGIIIKSIYKEKPLTLAKKDISSGKLVSYFDAEIYSAVKGPMNNSLVALTVTGTTTAKYVEALKERSRFYVLYGYRDKKKP